MKVVLKNNNKAQQSKLQALNCTILSLTNSLNDLIQFQRSNTSNQHNQVIYETFNTKTDARFRFVKIKIPKLPQLETDRTAMIKQFMGQLCKKVFEHAFAQFLDDNIHKDQVKIYCSENILYSVTQLIKINSLKNQDIAIINKCLKKDLLPYFGEKYPLSEGQGGNVAFQREIVFQNNIDDESNDLISGLKINFKLKPNANYNKQIMQFLNQLIRLTESQYNQFAEQRSCWFQQIFIKDQLIRMQKIDVKNLKKQGTKIVKDQNNDKKKSPKFMKEEQVKSLIKQTKVQVPKTEKNRQNINQIQAKKKEENFKIMNQPIQNNQNIQSNRKLEQKAKYRERVQQYTEYKIGRKLSSSIKPFSKKQILSGDLKLDNPALTRILTKWCEQLEKCFIPQNIINRQKPFKMMDGTYNFLQKKCWNEFLSLLLQREFKKIKTYKQSIMYHSNKMQKQFALKDNSQLKIYSQQEAEVGYFAIAIEKVNQGYLIGYLNKLIHAILSATTQYSSFIKRGIKQSHVKNLNQDSLNNIIKKFICYLEKQNINQKRKSPNLITFKVSDLLRCKCSSNQRQVIALYKELQRISSQNPQKLQIIRVKNRLNKGTKDILINMRIKNKYLAQAQLAITTTKSKFIKKSSQFRHYLYELQRAQFGPLNQMCNIWANKDDRSKIYKTFFEKRSLNRKSVEQREFPDCCQFQKKQHQLPFVCDFCEYFFSGSENEETFFQCRQCKNKLCLLCQEEARERIHFDDNISQESVQENQQKQIEQDHEQAHSIPLSGIIRSKRQPYREPIYFIKAETAKNLILLEQKQGKFHTVVELNKQTSATKAVSIVQALDSQNQLKKFFIQNSIQITNEERDFSNKMTRIKENYLVPKYLEECHRVKKNSINLTKQGITERAFINFMSVLPKKQNEQFKYLKQLNLSENQIEDTNFLSRYTDLQVLILRGCNNIQHLPQNIGKFKFLKVLDLSYCQNLRVLPDNFGCLTTLQKLNLQNLESIQALPDNFGDLINLQQLVITNCFKLIQLPQSFGHLQSLQKLIIQNMSCVQALPQNFEELDALQQLTISSFIKLNRLPHSFGSLDSLYKLNLQNLQLIQQLPDDLGQLDMLEQLNINKLNTLCSLPDNLGKLQSLSILYINQCKLIQRLPQNIGDLTLLKKLHIQSCLSLRQLPQSFGQLKNLQFLNIIQCYSLKLFPSKFEQLQSLESLHIEKVHTFNTLPQNFGNLKYLVKLSISNCNLYESLPDSFGQLDYLEELNIFGCRSFKFIPESFGKLRDLKIINIKKCQQLQHFPNSFGGLNALQIMTIDELPSVKQLPPNFGQLKNLRSLSISQMSSLSQLPQSFGQLKSLQSLVICRCKRIKQLPDNIGNLQKLSVLNIQSCQSFEKVPESFGKLKCLRKLRIILCKSIKSLPEKMDMLTSLQKIQIRDCCSLSELPESFTRLKKLRKSSLQQSLSGKFLKMWQSQRLLKRYQSEYNE